MSFGLRIALLGAALFVLDRQLDPAPTAPAPRVSAARLDAERAGFVATRGREPDAAERRALAERALDDELLFREAVARGYHRTDPLVRRRLARNLRFLRGAPDGAGDEAALHREALALGMHASDLVVRRRLVQKLELALAAAARRPEPSAAELSAHHAAHATRWEEPGRVVLDQVFLSRTLRGGAAAAAAHALAARLRGGEPGAEALGDPLPFAAATSWAHADLARYLGDAFASAVLALPVGEWSAPLVSSQGLHLVRVRERRAGGPLPLARARSAVREDLLAARGREARRVFLEALRRRHGLGRVGDPS